MRLSALLSRGSLIGTDWQERDFLVGVAFCICPSLCTGETPWKSSWAQSLLLERSCPLQAMQGLGACGRGVWLTSEREGKAHSSCRREQKRKKNNYGERCEREQSAGKYSKTTSGQRRHRVLKSGCLSGRVLHTCMAPAARASFPRHKYWSHKTCLAFCACQQPVLSALGSQAPWLLAVRYLPQACLGASLCSEPEQLKWSSVSCLVTCATSLWMSPLLCPGARAFINHRSAVPLTAMSPLPQSASFLIALSHYKLLWCRNRWYGINTRA